MGERALDIMTDDQLVVLSQRGDLDAFNQLVQRWEASLYHFVRRTVGNSEEARDVCQEALTRGFQNIERLRDGTKFKAWIHHIALNLCRDKFRSQRSRADLRSLDEFSAEELQEATSDARPIAPDAQVTRASLCDLLGGALERLPVEQRTAIVLREYHGFNSEEIGEITGVPAATVRTRIFYGLKSMRRAFQERGISGIEMLQGEES
ncbi:MAG: RNA polymerase sigma factor [Candidatus Eisenbacteria bacterium]|uniref:RNA polymerase sigma factor n=1 Tax=Eiseniibacteriota bacterium TaxID=2212470 RepID=A0A956RQ45_UNCEI|nr:RNA polymerase sigma factor [Candidatus Eisenbacteria bacterium]